MENQATAMILCGSTGSGKSRLLDQFNIQSGGALQILRPSLTGVAGPLVQVDWHSHAAVVVDDIESKGWPEGIPPAQELEAAAAAHGKKLILVIQHQDDLHHLGIVLKNRVAPFLVRIVRDATLSLPMQMQGDRLAFDAIGARPPAKKRGKIVQFTPKA